MINIGAIKDLNTYADELLAADNEVYASKHLAATSSHRFLATIMASGTLSDKISALTLVVQESPVHSTKAFQNLLNLAKKRSRSQAIAALGALKDLLGTGVVLPADRRLRSFANQPGIRYFLKATAKSKWTSKQPLPGLLTKAHLISWAFEDWLKDCYFEMLKILESWSIDEIEYARMQAVTYVYDLLKEKPEQESNLLRLLVNKIGDPDKKLASRVSHFLLQLQNSHPLMKPVIVQAIETELLRPGQSLHAKYYAVTTLNQTILSTKEEALAHKLLDIYFDMFTSILKQRTVTAQTVAKRELNRKGQVQGGGGKGGKMAKVKQAQDERAQQANVEMNEKMISAILTGINRAFPFSGSSTDV